ncbi:hypothetical protein [Mycetohabitans endofungorum]|uniref:hypothetical protein n=1 Tax=Mycetohabitans endofungorum TaxID=417203 RepID=UPI002B05ED0B|nr:hypothetical protein [Mycetohabitans endofungorum]
MQTDAVAVTSELTYDNDKVAIVLIMRMLSNAATGYLQTHCERASAQPKLLIPIAFARHRRDSPFAMLRGGITRDCR